MATERSRAYPMLPLEDGRRLIGEIVGLLGNGAFSREVLGEALGYSNARGGPGARKIAALVQYGFLRRKAGLYSPTDLAREALEMTSEGTRETALRLALRKPPLFEALLDRYKPQGRVPSQLAGVLWREYGITKKASQAAAETFHRSARYAGVLNRHGAFLAESVSVIEDLESSEDHPTNGEPSPQERPGFPAEQRFEFVLTRGQVARLFLPLNLTKRDLEIIRRQIDFLEYQAKEEEAP